MNRIKAFLYFWYRFIVGDDWRIAATMIVTLIIISALTTAGFDAWPLFLVLVVGALTLSVVRAAGRAAPKRRPRPVVLALAWIELWLPLVLIGATPIFANYLKSLADTSVQDLMLPLTLNTIAATIIAGLYFRAFLARRFTFYLAAVFTAIVVVNDYANNFQWASTTFDAAWPLPMPIALFEPIYLIVAAYLLYRLAAWINQRAVAHHWRTQEVSGLITVAIAALFALRFVPAAVDLAEAWPQFFYHPPALQAHLAATTKPDIYYLFLEDYNDQQPIPQQYNFTTSGFGQYLTAQGFTTAPVSRGNYPYAVSTVAATLSAGYLSDQVNRFNRSQNQTQVPYAATIESAPVTQSLKKLGYTYDLLGAWGNISNTSPLASRTYSSGDQLVLAGHTLSLNEFSDNELQQNVFWPFFQAGLPLGSFKLLGYNTSAAAAHPGTQFEQLQALAKQPAGGRFIFKDIVGPPDFTGLRATISAIMRSSHGRADIIVQSGQPPRPQAANETVAAQLEDKGNMLTWSKANLQLKFGLLTSYYVPGAPAADIAQAEDPVNTFRLVLNTNFAAHLPYLPTCYYGYPQGRANAFVFSNLNRALTGGVNAACPANANFIHPGPTKLIVPKAKRTNANQLDDDD